ARVSVVDLVRSWHGSDLREALGQGDHALVVKIGTRHVDQFGGLPLDCLYYTWMAVAGRGHRDPGGEIEELVAVGVFYPKAASAFRDHWVGARVRRGNVLVIGLHDVLGIGAGQCGLNLRSGSGQSLGWHGILQNRSSVFRS